MSKIKRPVFIYTRYTLKSVFYFNLISSVLIFAPLENCVWGMDPLCPPCYGSVIELVLIYIYKLSKNIIGSNKIEVNS